MMQLVSVVLAVRNEEGHIGRSLAQLLDQDYPRDRLEVIVADGRSTDRTRAIVESFLGRELEIRLVDNPGLGRAQGLNAAIRIAKGEVIVRMDARTVIGPDYVSRCVRTLLETGADNVGGVQQPLADTPVQEAIGLAMSHPFGVGNAMFRLGGQREIPGSAVSPLHNARSATAGCSVVNVLGGMGLRGPVIVCVQTNKPSYCYGKAAI